MISTAYVQTMAAYNRWQNGSLYAAAATLSDAERKLPRGAFFGSIHGTLNHIVWGDRMWLSRFTPAPPPPAVSSMAETPNMHPAWDDLVAARNALDDDIDAWALRLDATWLEGELNWTSAALKREFTKPLWQLVTHMFNHQTHHRGQAHAMLTAAGARPDDTDIPFMPESS
ncbi:MAG: DinB family protein [Proteobacteria bacterium]|nr:DinB family protein [Pseudomonadota bacterium]MDA1357699.1 DinB family protein [Pseudomonadota bacterium]